MISTRVESVEALVAEVGKLDSGWCFRGHRCADWSLTTTLERLFPQGRWHPGLAVTLERIALNQFQTRMPHYVARDVVPRDRLSWLATMQHHGVPTRMLDVTESPLVALFFALPPPSHTCDFAVWAVNFREINKSTCAALKVNYRDFQVRRGAFFENEFEGHGEPQIILTDPDVSNFRLERQKGFFIATNSAAHRICDVLKEDSNLIHKFTLPGSCADGARKLLIMAAIDHSRVFGDLDGLSRDIATDLEWRVHRGGIRK